MFWAIVLGGACALGALLGLQFLMGKTVVGVMADGTPYSPEVIAAAERSIKKSGARLLAGCSFGLIAVIGWYIFYYSSAGNTAARHEADIAARCEDAGMAYVMSQNFVKRQLKVPSSAKFPYKPAAQDYTGNCRHSIVGTFESQNSFGAMTHGSYRVIMIYLPNEDKWRAENMNIQ
ncbi:hypothetical protein [Stutzerimonas frequens]|uniref:Uncharacterized protein n=1 Tax=Stutzerimonas frequens TaxID=2968969 RepID=A0AA47HWW7_9GAMM|nr:hypothetical protein [Stutzerimonas frequens]WAE51164.1 hypothetical protein OSV15_15965 [Stutzerimonas frequens]